MAASPYAAGKGAGAKNAAPSDGLRILKERLGLGTGAKSGSLSAGVFLFYGEEEYLKRSYYEALLRASHADADNITVIDEDDFSFEKLYDAVCTAPAEDYAAASLFTDENAAPQTSFRIVRAEGAPAARFSDREKKALTALLSPEALPPHVCVVFYYRYNPKKETEYSKSIKLLAAVPGVVDVPFVHELPQSASLRRWVKRHFDAAHCTVDAGCIDSLIETVGTDMSALDFEMQKLCAYACAHEQARGGRTVLQSDVEALCTPSVDARLSDAVRCLISGNYGGAEKVLTELRREKQSETYIFGAISKQIAELCTVDACRKEGMREKEIAEKANLRDYAVRNCLRMLDTLDRDTARFPRGRGEGPCAYFARLLAEYDEKLKSAPSDKYLLLDNLAFKLTHPNLRKDADNG